MNAPPPNRMGSPQASMNAGGGSTVHPASPAMQQQSHTTASSTSNNNTPNQPQQYRTSYQGHNNQQRNNHPSSRRPDQSRPVPTGADEKEPEFNSEVPVMNLKELKEKQERENEFYRQA